MFAGCTIYSADYSPTALAEFKEEITKVNLADIVQPALMSDPSLLLRATLAQLGGPATVL